MIAVDTGFIYALVDASDRWHTRAKAYVGTAEEGWITTWPVVSEAEAVPSANSRLAGPPGARRVLS